MPRKLTQQEFLEKAYAVHGYVYDYSDVVYTNNSTDIKIICSIHGPFFQKPNSHLDQRSGCKKCGRQKRDKKHTLTIEKFIQRAHKAHNHKYDYSKVTYTHNTDIITIICPLHGEFQQQAYSHIKTNCFSGCPRCGNLGVSNKAIKWINTISNSHSINIQHALNGGEYRIPGTRYKADGYCQETNTIYEFYGDKWHGNIKRFEPNQKCHPFSEKTAIELYNETIQREELLKTHGYQVVSIWERDYDNGLI